MHNPFRKALAVLATAALGLLPASPALADGSRTAPSPPKSLAAKKTEAGSGSSISSRWPRRWSAISLLLTALSAASFTELSSNSPSTSILICCCCTLQIWGRAVPAKYDWRCGSLLCVPRCVHFSRRQPSTMRRNSKESFGQRIEKRLVRGLEF